MMIGIVVFTYLTYQSNIIKIHGGCNYTPRPDSIILQESPNLSIFQVILDHFIEVKGLR